MTILPRAIENKAGCHLVIGINRPGNSTSGFCYDFVFLASFFPFFFFPLFGAGQGLGSGTHALVHVKEVLYYWLYPQPKEISAEALSQDSGVVHGLGQDGILDLQGHNSDTYHGIGVEQRFCLRSVC